MNKILGLEHDCPSEFGGEGDPTYTRAELPPK